MNENKENNKFTDKLNKSIESCENMLLSLDSVKQELSELTLYQQNLSDKVKFFREDFFNSIRQNDVEKVKYYFDWGIDKIPNLLMIKSKQNNTWSANENTQKETVFNTNKDLNLVEQEMRELLILNSPLSLRPYFENLLVNRLLQNLLTTHFKINEYDVNLLQWTLINKSELFKQHLENLTFNHWGRIPFDLEKHQILHEYVIENHPNLINTFSNLNKYGHFSNMTMEELYELKPYKKIIDQLSVNQLREIGQKELVTALEKGNPSAMNFWLSFYIPLPTEKKLISQFLAECYKNKNFFEALNVVISNIDINIHEHIMLRSAISNDHEKTVEYLLMHYPADELPSVEDVFKTRSNPVPQSHKDMLSRLLNYHHLNKTLNTSNVVKIKNKI